MRDLIRATLALAKRRTPAVGATSSAVSDADLLAPIVAFANGDESLRDRAIALHRTLLTSRPDLRRHPAQSFMSEVDTPCPDLGLRAANRKLLAA